MNKYCLDLDGVLHIKYRIKMYNMLAFV